MTETVVWPQMAFEFASVDDSRRLDIFNIGTKEIFQMFKGRSHGNDLAKSLATDSIAANVMVAYASITIVYMNRAVTEFLTEAESDIQKDLPRAIACRKSGASIPACSSIMRRGTVRSIASPVPTSLPPNTLRLT